MPPITCHTRLLSKKQTTIPCCKINDGCGNSNGSITTPIYINSSEHPKPGDLLSVVLICLVVSTINLRSLEHVFTIHFSFLYFINLYQWSKVEKPLFVIHSPVVKEKNTKYQTIKTRKKKFKKNTTLDNAALDFWRILG